MSNLNILSGGAAQGLVGSLAPAFKAQTGFEITGEFGAVGSMAEKLRKGTPADIVILTGGDRCEARRGEAGSRRFDFGCWPGGNRPCRPSRSSQGHGQGCRRPAQFVPCGRCDLCAGHPSVDGRDSHREDPAQLGIADEVTDRLKIFPNGATAMRELAASDARHPIGCTQSTEIISTKGVTLSGSLPAGCELATMYRASITSQAAHAPVALVLIGLLTGAGQRDQRERAGFISGSK